MRRSAQERAGVYGVATSTGTSAGTGTSATSTGILFAVFNPMSGWCRRSTSPRRLLAEPSACSPRGVRPFAPVAPLRFVTGWPQGFQADR